MIGLRYLRKGFVLLLAFALSLSACQRFIPVTTTQVPTEIPKLAVTGGPSVAVQDQTTDGSQVVIAKVISVVPGWVAIHTVKDGIVSDSSIGHEFVNVGETDNIVVKLEPGKATDELMAMLHEDHGKPGVYEGSQIDYPVDGSPSIVQPMFMVTFTQQGSGNASSVTPVLEVADQNIVNGIVKISRIVSDKDVWVVVHDDHDGKVGDVIGRTLVTAGDRTDVEVQVDPTHKPDSPVFYVILYLDAGQKGEFEIPTADDPTGPDVPLKINDQVVQKTFTTLDQANTGGATPGSGSEGPPSSTETAMPSMEGMNTQMTPIPAPKTPEITGQTCMAPVAPKDGVIPVIQVSDQDLMDGAVHVDKVVSDGPGWVVIWTQPQSGEAEAIGSAQVQDGENQNVTVPVDASKATPQLVAILHLDGGQLGTFEPDKDCIVHVGVQMIQAGFSTMGEMAMTTEAVGSDLKIVVQDQPLRGGNTIIIPEVVSHGPGWIGIHLTEPDGSVSHSAAIGAGHLDDGLNTNVVVRLTDPGRATEKLWAMLHVDKGTLFQYEYPNPHIDTPVEVNGQALVAPFMITGGLPGQPVVINVSDNGATPYLVDGQGFSLYTSTSECKDQCLKEWLPFLATGQVETKEGVNSQKLRIVGLGDGNKQVTYDLLPLYYYIGDFKPGDTNGQGLDGKWFLAQP